MLRIPQEIGDQLTRSPLGHPLASQYIDTILSASSKHLSEPGFYIIICSNRSAKIAAHEDLDPLRLQRLHQVTQIGGTIRLECVRRASCAAILPPPQSVTFASVKPASISFPLEASNQHPQINVPLLPDIWSLWQLGETPNAHHKDQRRSSKGRR